MTEKEKLDVKKYPNGKLNVDDQGVAEIKISAYKNTVVMRFNTPMNWVGMPPDLAAEIGVALIRRAREIGLKKPVTIEL